MAAALTPVQRQIVDAICASMREHGRPPSVPELGRSVGIASRDQLRDHLLALRRAGYLRADPTEPDVIEVRCGKVQARSADSAARRVVDDPATVERTEFVDVPLLVQEIGGGAHALAPTTPLSTEQQIQATYSLPRRLVGTGELFMLQVRGDSMADAGVLDGDYVVVRAQKTAAHGDMVLAMLDTEPPELTVKYLRLRGRRIDSLVPANPSSPVIEGRRVAAIQGRVVAVIRRLGGKRPA